MLAPLPRARSREPSRHRTALAYQQIRLLREILPFQPRCYHRFMYAQKFQVDVLIRGERKPCPMDWLDQFCMRNFTNSAEFDDTLPVADGRLEASFRLTPERFAEGLSAWLTQRGKGEGQPIRVQVQA